MLKYSQIKTLCIEVSITGESNKLLGLATEAEVGRIQDTEQGLDLFLKRPLIRFKGSLNITLVNKETTLTLTLLTWGIW
jgi:hypothetical protein